MTLTSLPSASCLHSRAWRNFADGAELWLFRPWPDVLKIGLWAGLLWLSDPWIAALLLNLYFATLQFHPQIIGQLGQPDARTLEFFLSLQEYIVWGSLVTDHSLLRFSSLWLVWMFLQVSLLLYLGTLIALKRITPKQTVHCLMSLGNWVLVYCLNSGHYLELPPVLDFCLLPLEIAYLFALPKLLSFTPSLESSWAYLTKHWLFFCGYFTFPVLAAWLQSPSLMALSFSACAVQIFDQKPGSPQPVAFEPSLWLEKILFSSGKKLGLSWKRRKNE